MYYASIGFSEKEIPIEKNLVIYISDCQNHCKGCHTPYLHETYGDLLINNFEQIYQLYKNYITCVCFMGEGKGDNCSKREFEKYCQLIHKDGKKTALYSGRECDIEEWMLIFDYIKLGSYKEKYGPLTNLNTNQRLYRKTSNNDYENITYVFWQ